MNASERTIAWRIRNWRIRNWRVLNWHLLIWGLALAALLIVIVRGPPLRSDLAQFLPSAHDPAQALLLDELRSGAGARLILLKLSGLDPAALAQASHALSTRLRADAAFTDVRNGARDAVDPALERLFEYRYLLAELPPDAFSQSALHTDLQARLRELSAGLVMPDKARLAADPNMLFRRIARGWLSSHGPTRRHGVWFGTDDSALILLRTRHGGYDLDRQQATVNTLHEAFASLPEHARLDMQMSGPGIIALAARARIRHDVRMISVAASVGIALLLWLSFRSLRLTLIAGLPLLTGMAAGTAGVLLIFGELHGIAMAFGATLIGVAVDYPVHLFSHLASHPASHPAGPVGERHPAQRAMTTIWPVMRIGLLTTVLGYGALLGSEYGSLAQLAVFSVLGLLAAAATTRWLLPSLIPAELTPRIAPRNAPRNVSGSALAGLSTRLFAGVRRPWLVPLALVAGVGLTAIHAGHLWQHDLAALSPVPSAARALDQALRRAFGAPDFQHLLMITGADPEQVLRQSEAVAVGLDRLIREHALDAYQAPSDLLPSAATQYRRARALPDADTLRATLRDALEDLPFKPGVFDPFVAAVERSHQLPALRLTDLADSALGLRLGGQLRPHDAHWLGVITLSGVHAPEALARLAEAHGEAVFFVDIRAASSALVGANRDAALRHAAIGLGLILLALALALRSLRLWLRVAGPVLATVAMTTGSLTMLGEGLSLFHIAALLLVIGIGVDYALFIARTPRQDPAFDATTAALLLCGVSTLLVFGLLSLSDAPVLRSIGLTVVMGTLFNLILAAAMVHNVAPSDPHSG